MLTYDEQEFTKSVGGLIVPNITRAVVVSTADPLRMGRVQVWIPTLHGMLIGGEDEDAANTAEEVLVPNPDGEHKPGYSDPAAIASKLRSDRNQINTILPWAQVMGSGWGPTGNVYTGESINAQYGSLSVPKPGTEVYVTFEQDDPELPIILGTIFHNREALTLAPDKVTELAPGIKAYDKQESAGLVDGTYDEHISDVLVTRSNGGQTFVISDVPGKEEISLFSTVKYGANSNVEDQGAYERFRSNYPVFPTTATAARISRVTQGASSPLTVIQETPPVILPKGSRSLPFTATPGPTTSGQLFKAPRDGGARLHAGKDYSLAIGVNVIAPIDGECMSMVNNISSAAGRVLYFRGIDNSVHAFMHLDSIENFVIDGINRGGTVKVSQGTVIAKVGKSGVTKSGKGYSPHLHWEVGVPAEGTPLIANKGEFGACITALKRGGIYQGRTYAYMSMTNPDDWVGGGSGIVTTPGQLDTHANSFVYGADSDKYLGVQITTTRGAESIYLRHSSGSYIGIDMDGNINIFSVGDINIKGNRSFNIQLIGAFIMNCLAGFIRSKSVWQVMSMKMRNMGIWFDNWKKWPSIMKTMEEAQFKDMNDMLRYSTENVKASYKGSTTPLANISTGSGGTLTQLSNPPARSVNMTTYDAIIKSTWSTIINASDLPNQIKVEFSPTLLKSLMLHESNGQVDAKSKAGARGLFQLTPITVKDITGDSNIENYLTPEKSTEVACKLLVKVGKRLISEMRDDISAGRVNNMDIVNLTLASYNVGVTYVSNSIKSVRSSGKTPTYKAVEGYWTDRGVTSELLNFVPGLDYLKTKVKI